MRLRAPAYPLITIDPYFSVWSFTDKLTDKDTFHWTGSPVRFNGICTIDGVDYRFMGASEADKPAMNQVSVDVDCFSTTYVFEQSGIRITAKFTSPVIPQDLYYMTRPVSYLELTKVFIDGHKHTVSYDISVSEEICMDKAGEGPVDIEEIALDKLSSIKMGLRDQKTLGRSGDDLRIEWGYFYLTGLGTTYQKKDETGVSYVGIKAEAASSNLITFAYDDVYCIEYFGEHLKSYWNNSGADIKDEIVKAHKDYKKVLEKCTSIDKDLFVDAVKAGGEKYAEMLQLAFRQAVDAHKVAIDKEGNVLCISKECFSNGCAATVDVSYPSIPFFLIYNPELVKGMMRPIYKYAQSPAWPFDFAPHDCGQFPLVHGQVYGDNKLEMQMPVEECGNMLVMEATVALATGDASFAVSHMDVLDKWVKYLVKYGSDPENQLCTDDFAGHLAHNCNLSLKAIMGIAGYGIIKGMTGNKAEKRQYLTLAKKMADDWTVRAANGDGSFRLAFDKPGSFSMKYNVVWDILFGTNLFPKTVIESEVSSYFKKMQPYGLALDNRSKYTKSDWLVWTATLASNREDFERMVEPMWEAYNSSESRVPMTDWYWTHTAGHLHFRNRSVIGGLFIKLLQYRGF